jgi:hypothetical protein
VRGVLGHPDGLLERQAGHRHVEQVPLTHPGMPLQHGRTEIILAYACPSALARPAG